MRIKHFALPLWVMISAVGSIKAQRFIWSPDSISQANPNYAMDRYHDILRYHEPPMYLAFPVIKALEDRGLPLNDGEGKNGYWAEGQFGHRFIIYKGKYYSSKFGQRTRFTFDVNLVSRLTQDNSSPLLPLNNKFGFGWDFLFSPLKNLDQEKARLLWSTIQIHHYSNGQADSFFLKDQLRNNYRSGDFSTNYIRGLLNLATTSKQENIFTTALGYELDFNAGKPFSRSIELDSSYGEKRLLLQLNWIKKPRLMVTDVSDRNDGTSGVIKVEKRQQFAFRSEFEYILGDVSKYRPSNKSRLAWHNYFTFMPSITNEVGFMLHTYIGRDYLNIRFDDIVFIGELGLYVKFNSH
jgi:hypothetical protein